MQSRCTASRPDSDVPRSLDATQTVLKATRDDVDAGRLGRGFDVGIAGIGPPVGDVFPDAGAEEQRFLEHKPDL